MWWAWDSYNRDQEAKESPIPLLEEWGFFCHRSRRRNSSEPKLPLLITMKQARFPQRKSSMPSIYMSGSLTSRTRPGSGNRPHRIGLQRNVPRYGEGLIPTSNLILLFFASNLNPFLPHYVQ